MVAISDADSRFRPDGVRRHANRLANPAQLGRQPAIETDGGVHTALDRRAVSLRWLAGTILTGLAGAALIGAAIYTALDRKLNFAETPEFAQATHKDEATGELVNPGKSDRLVQSVDVVAAKQSFRAPTTVQVGNKSIVKVRSFTHVSTTLETTAGAQADEVPPFNPLKLITDAPDQPPPPPPDAAPIQDDEEISFTTRDLAGASVVPSENLLQPVEIQAQVAEEVKAVHNPVAHPLRPLAPQMLLMRTTHAGLDPSVLGYAAIETPTTPAPFSSIAVRMVPENVTLVPRSPDSADNLNREQLVIVRHGDTLEDILHTAGATKDQIKGIVTAFKTKNGQSPVGEGQRIKLTFVDMDGTGTSAQIARLSVYNDETLQTTIALDDSGRYVQVQQPNATANNAKPKAADDDDDDDDDSSGLHIYNSLYETALKQNIPKPIIDELVRIFGNDIDFQRPVSAGDSFDAFYQNADEIDNRDQLLYASITTRNATYKYFRFQTPDDSLVDYYDESGRSNRKFLLRQPVASARMSSPFGSREHPILGYVRMHTGVDWAAPMGTQVFATGNGVIVKAGRESGYGNRIEIQHANGYITTYSHLSGFARGIAEGVHVRQGQVVAYLGMTGLATGPHIHYEVIVNGHFVDPLRVKLARTRELNGPTLDNFKRERDRIESLMAQGPGAAPAAATVDARR